MYEALIDGASSLIERCDEGAEQAIGVGIRDIERLPGLAQATLHLIEQRGQQEDLSPELRALAYYVLEPAATDHHGSDDRELVEDETLSLVKSALDNRGESMRFSGHRYTETTLRRGQLSYPSDRLVPVKTHKGKKDDSKQVEFKGRLLPAYKDARVIASAWSDPDRFAKTGNLKKTTMRLVEHNKNDNPIYYRSKLPSLRSLLSGAAEPPLHDRFSTVHITTENADDIPSYSPEDATPFARMPYRALRAARLLSLLTAQSASMNNTYIESRVDDELTYWAHVRSESPYTAKT